MKLKICLNEKVVATREYDEPVCIKDIAEEIQEDHPYRIVCARFERHLKSLNHVLKRGGTLELLDMRDSDGKMCYQASLSLLYSKAVQDVAGSDVTVRINNSLSKGLYTTLKGTAIDEELVSRIEKRMRKLVAAKIPINYRVADRESIMEELKASNRDDILMQFELTPDLETVRLYYIEDCIWAFSDELVPDTGYLDRFELNLYKFGILLRFPHPMDPGSVPPFKEQKIIYDAFSEERNWSRVTGIRVASDLNRVILNNEYKDLILLCEALHEKKIAKIAEKIVEEQKQIILIAGPSSSGKTTFANRLCIQLRASGLKPLYLGTDDYFIDRIHTPLGEDGKPDFEGLSALDRDLLNRNLASLMKGEKVDLPSYSFKEGIKEFGKRIIKINPGQPIVIEGLHCLNPMLTEFIPDDVKFRIYISPLTQLNIDMKNRIPTTDARMLRRIVRDAQFRGYSADMTIDIWPKVNRGEDTNIFPFSVYADAFFNSASVYELAVLKRFAKPQLERITDRQPQYAEAQRLLRMLKFFVTIEEDHLIPNNSIVREFIGGSVIV